MTQFTDALGYPLNVGDPIVYPVQYGSSAVKLSYAIVVNIIPLVPKAGTWHATGRNARTPFLREDKQHTAYPTEYYVPMDSKWNYRMDKAYIVQVQGAERVDRPDVGVCVIQPEKRERKNTIHRIEKIIGMSSLIDAVEREDDDEL